MSEQIDDLVNKWLDQDPNETTRQEIKSLYASHDFDELELRLRNRIQFGTAGLRARMEAGFSRMNDLTVLQASQGLAKYVSLNVDNALKRGVVIGHDHRHNSARFAELTKVAFSHVGFTVYLYDGLVHTPMVPFGVDHLKAACGIMITASHNPARDNGYKVYWENACQIIPPHDSGIAAAIDENLQPWTWTVDADKQQLVENINLTAEYIRTIKLRLVGDGFAIDRKLKFVYTPMHGVGLPIMTQVCKDLLGLDMESNMVVVNEQAQPDPDFSTVKFPNPEEKGALDLAMATADEHGAQLILASDPDADRFAAAVKNSAGKWVQLTGNELGALFAFQILSDGTRGHKTAVINSTVSSQVIKHLAALYGAHYEDTLTGFKWIGNRAIDLEQQGYIVPFAFEEALGYMFPVVHDKDGITAALMFLALVSKYKVSTQGGQQVLDVLETIYSKVGYFKEHNDYYISPSPAVTDSVFEYIRSSKVDKTKVGEFLITGWRDLTTGYDSSTKDHKPTLQVSASSQMITVSVKGPDDSVARFTARGSGTEPKLKVYIEAKAASVHQAQHFADQVWQTLSETWFRPGSSGLNQRS